MNRSIGMIMTVALGVVLVACGGGGSGSDGGGGGPNGGAAGNAFLATVQEVIDTPNANATDPRATAGIAATPDEAAEPQAIKVN